MILVEYMFIMHINCIVAMCLQVFLSLRLAVWNETPYFILKLANSVDSYKTFKWPSVNIEKAVQGKIPDY